MSDFSRGFQGMIKGTATRLAGVTLLIALATMLGGCGSGAVSAPPTPDNGPATLVLALTDLNATTARTSISTGNPAKLSATFKTGRGVAIVGAVITFTTNGTLGAFMPSTGTALTDANGVASVTLSSSTASGAGTVTATGSTTLAGATTPTTYTSAVSFTSTVEVGMPTLTLALTELNSSAPRTSISFASPAKVSATFKNGRGDPIAGAVITFTTEATLGTFDPTAGTALTDANGVASVTLNSSTASGAGTVTASGTTTPVGSTTPSTYRATVTYSTTAGGSGAPTFSVTLTDPTTNAARTSVAPQNPARVTATLRNSNGTGFAGAVVRFTTTTTVGTFVPSNGSAVTDANGNASVLLFPSTASGSDLVTAATSVQFPGIFGASTFTGSVAYTSTAASAITVALTDPTTGAARTSITAGSPARVSATLRQTSGAPSVGTVVTFTTDPLLGVFSPTNGTALTDSNGVANVLLSPASLTTAGAATVTASAQIGSGAGAPVTTSVGYSVGASNVTISPVNIQSPVLSAFGTTGLSVTVSVLGVPTSTPLTVNFTSPCAANGRASLTTSAVTVNGIASATYRDIGCASADTITASVSGLGLTSTGTLSIAAPAVGSIQFVSASPTTISLRGTGGAGRQETSLVSFRVVDVAGNPVGGRTVNFTLNTSVGGITVTPTSAVSDASTGLVVTNVQSGTVATPVRVTATTVSGTQTLTTQSDQLTISTGVPSQGGFSLSVSTLNIEGGDIDGNTTQITARLADRFSNPVPNGTAVNFIAAGGSIVSSCTTTAGACSVTLTSQNFRTSNGRIAVLAYAIGEESFTDLNGNGWFDTGELVDLNLDSTDLPEAWLDVNENRVRDPNEPFIDFNSMNGYESGDGKFNGISCDDTVAGRSAPGSCGTSRSIHVRGQKLVVFSTSAPDFLRTPTINGTPITSNTIQLSTCSTAALSSAISTTVIFRITDLNGNALPAGTTVAFATTNGTITSVPNTFTVQNTTACANPGCANPGVAVKCPSGNADLLQISGSGLYSVQLQPDWTQFANGTPPPAFTCANARDEGVLTATVRTPSGRTTTSTVVVKD